MEDKIDKIIKKRAIIMGIILSVIFMVLSARLYYLQVSKNDEYTLSAMKQRGKEFSIYPNRGTIFDRNLRPITNNELVHTIIIEKQLLMEDDVLYDKVLNSTHLNQKELNEQILKSKDLLQIPLQNTNLFNYSESRFFIVDIVKRYSKGNPLAHVIGYTNKSDNIGEAGIEAVHDEYLSIDDKTSFMVEYDRDRDMILGGSYYANYNANANNPSGVQLTIDLDIQNIVEKILDDKKLNGAVVISEIESGDILAMASRPNYNQDNVNASFNSKDTPLFNKAIRVGYPPGSIFKIIVLLATLEENLEISNYEFYCPGYEVVNGESFRCSSVHGKISIEEAFAKSCNSAFIQLGKSVGPQNIISMAKKLGFGSKIDIGLLEEVNGKLPKESELFGAAIGNISIGQDKLEVTPLQATNLLMILANQGIQKDLSIIKGITNKDGIIIKDYFKEVDHEILPSESAEYLLERLRDVVQIGTASSMNLDDYGSAGGKTGSAEAVLNKRHVVHGWFAGFYPSMNPKYVITVLIEDSEIGSLGALPVFEQISKSIYNNNL